MDEQHLREALLDGAASTAGRERAPTVTSTNDRVAQYIRKNIDMDSLSEDIRNLVANRIENSIPDDKRLMLDLMMQMDTLTGEVKQLRQKLDSKPYAVFACPSGQMKDLTAELAEIKQLLQREPAPQILTQAQIDTVVPETQALLHTAPTESPPAAETADATRATFPTAQEAVPQPVPSTSEPEPEAVMPEPKAKKKKKHGALSILGNVLFYVALIAFVVGIFLAKSGSGGQPTVIAGYSAFTVLSSSMEDTYPKGSLIVTRSVDTNTLKIGDDITYMSSATSSITHRIIGITEDYLGTGARGFETQGTMNDKPDKEPVAAANVVGQVIFCSTLLGQAATFVSANWPILLFFVAVLSALIAFLRWNFSRKEEPQSYSAPKKRRKHRVVSK